MDIKDNERKTIIDVFTTLVDKGKLSSSNVRNGLLKETLADNPEKIIKALAGAIEAAKGKDGV
jgi:hypothetical protein